MSARTIAAPAAAMRSAFRFAEAVLTTGLNVPWEATSPLAILNRDQNNLSRIFWNSSRVQRSKDRLVVPKRKVGRAPRRTCCGDRTYSLAQWIKDVKSWVTHQRLEDERIKWCKSGRDAATTHKSDSTDSLARAQQLRVTGDLEGK